jgi:hypothetical protein
MDNETEKKTVSLRSIGTTLKNGAQVAIGYVPDLEHDDSYWLRFTDPKGNITRLRMSHQAMEAIFALKPKVDLERNSKAVMAWQIVVDTKIPPDEVSPNGGPSSEPH